MQTPKRVGVGPYLIADSVPFLDQWPATQGATEIVAFFWEMRRSWQAWLRKAARRDIEALWKEIEELLKMVSPSECTNYFASCGFVNT